MEDRAKRQRLHSPRQSTPSFLSSTFGVGARDISILLTTIHLSTSVLTKLTAALPSLPTPAGRADEELINKHLQPTLDLLSSSICSTVVLAWGRGSYSTWAQEEAVKHKLVSYDTCTDSWKLEKAGRDVLKEEIDPELGEEVLSRFAENSRLFLEEHLHNLQEASPSQPVTWCLIEGVGAMMCHDDPEIAHHGFANFFLSPYWWKAVPPVFAAYVGRVLAPSMTAVPQDREQAEFLGRLLDTDQFSKTPRAFFGPEARSLLPNWLDNVAQLFDELDDSATMWGRPSWRDISVGPHLAQAICAVGPVHHVPSVLHVHQDSDGVLWLVTPAGIFRGGLDGDVFPFPFAAAKKIDWGPDWIAIHEHGKPLNKADLLLIKVSDPNQQRPLPPGSSANTGSQPGLIEVKTPQIDEQETITGFMVTIFDLNSPSGLNEPVSSSIVEEKDRKRSKKVSMSVWGPTLGQGVGWQWRQDVDGSSLFMSPTLSKVTLFDPSRWAAFEERLRQNNVNKRLRRHAREGNKLLLAFELAERGAHIDSVDYYGDTALHDAVRNAEHECVELLLKEGSRAVNLPNAHGRTPLFEAGARGVHVPTIHSLFSNGAFVDEVEDEELYGSLIFTKIQLYGAAKEGRVKPFLALEAGYDLNKPLTGALTPLCVALVNRRYTLAETLMSDMGALIFPEGGIHAVQEAIVRGVPSDELGFAMAGVDEEDKKTLIETAEKAHLIASGDIAGVQAAVEAGSDLMKLRLADGRFLWSFLTSGPMASAILNGNRELTFASATRAQSDWEDFIPFTKGDIILLEREDLYSYTGVNPTGQRGEVRPSRLRLFQDFESY